MTTVMSRAVAGCSRRVTATTISHLVAAPLAFPPLWKCDSRVPVLGANGFSGLVVREEIRLFGTDLFKLILEGVYSFDIDCTVRQTVPSIQYTDREEVKSCIACTVSFNQFFHLWPRVYLPSAS